MKTIVALILAMIYGLFGEAEAAPQNSPDTVVCSGKRMGATVCEVPTRRGGVEPIRYIDDFGIERVGRIPTQVSVWCQGGVCEDGKWKEYRGEAPNGLYIVYNDYLLTTINGQAVSYRHGTEPALASNQSRTDRIDLSCSPTSDYCLLNGVDYTREQLKGKVPMATVSAEFGKNWQCLDAYCEDDDGKVLGLNPFYWAYQ